MGVVWFLDLCGRWVGTRRLSPAARAERLELPAHARTERRERVALRADGGLGRLTEMEKAAEYSRSRRAGNAGASRNTEQPAAR